MESKCSICLEKLEENDFTKTKCGHFFHFTCVCKWVLKSNTCPICRNYIIQNEVNEKTKQNYENSSHISEIDLRNLIDDNTYIQINDIIRNSDNNERFDVFEIIYIVSLILLIEFIFIVIVYINLI